jgi:phosphoribosylglycinamide formyltransferase-1
MTKIGVLVSGNGSNLQAIIDSIEAGELEASIELVVSDNPEAKALERAIKHGIKTQVVTKAVRPDKKEFDQTIVDALKEAGVELVCLAGFMRIITPLFLNAFPMKIINIHPALLPSFPGLNVQQKALNHGAKFSGATVHFVDEGIDSGPIILQAAVPILDDDTTETLSARILVEEHRIYPEAIKLVAGGLLELKGRRVIIKAG